MPSAGKRGKYLGFVAHEIKNPLATALWSCDLLKRMQGADRTGERADKMLDASLRALRRMRRLIDDFFTIERLQEQGYDLKRERLDLRELVGVALQTLAEKDGIATEGWVVDVGEAGVVGDSEMLKRALRGAIEQMARSSSGSRLTISTQAAQTAVELQIRAEKPLERPIPPDPEDRASGDPSGSVLGYALAARILDSHGGKIEEREGGIALSFPAAGG